MNGSLSFSLRALVGLAALSAATAGRAQTRTPTINCYDASARPNPVYVAGSSAVRPFLGVVAVQMAAETPPYTLVYQSQGSCTGVNAIYSTDPTKRVMKDIPAQGSSPANYAILFNADGSVTECFLDPAGNPVDVGVSDVFPASCGATAPAGVQIADYEGPIQPMTFVVPTVSTQRTISAEAAYMVFGLGGNGGAAAPWTDPSLYFVRNSSSGTQQMLARSIDVPATQWWGVDRGSATNVRNALKLLLDPATGEKAIGILSTDITDDERSNLRVLAFQEKGQKCGYLPDSTPFSSDKLNVRDGHYPIWGPVHFLARTSGGLPNSAAQSLVIRFAAAKLNQSVLDTIIAKHLIPKCAMRVKRSTELGALSRYSTDARCECYFELKANGSTSCKPCSGPGECTAEAPACNYGYCEAP